jgi:iron complex outermembrane receptor protein
MKLRGLGWIMPALALPAQAATLTEADFLADLPVVLTVSKMEQPLQDSPSSVTVIDQDMIRASGYQDIPDLLRLVPGFTVAYTRDNTYAVGYHGFADAYSRRFQVLVDGRSIYSPNFGEVGWSTLPLALEDIDRIEVVRGPNAAVYGANAFFAIINIISKDPSQTQGKMMSLLAGEQNTAGAVFRYGGEQGDLRYRITLSDQHRDRFEKTFDDPRDGSHDNYYERTYTRFINGKWDYRLSNTDQLSGQVGLTGGNWNAGRDSNAFEPRSTDPLNAFAQFRFDRTTGPDEEMYVQFSHTYADQGANREIVPVPPHYGDVISDPNLKQWRTQLEFSSAHRVNEGLRLVWGGEVQYEAVEGRGWYGTGSKQDGAVESLFTHLEWRPDPDWLVQGGAQVAHHYFTGFELSPRLAVSYRVNPQNTLRFAASRAYRSPTFFEENGNISYYNTDGVMVDKVFIPAKGLDPEVNDSVEIGYLGQWPKWGTQLDVRLYRDHVTDYIGEQSIKSTLKIDGLNIKDKYFQHVNGGTLDVTGADAQLVWKPLREFSVHLAQSWAHIEASHDTVDDDLAKSAPDWITSVLASWRFAPGWNVSGTLYWVDNMMWLSDGDTTQGYTRTDLRLARQFKLSGSEAEWAVGVQDLGENYSEFRRENVYTQRAYTSLKFSW